VYVFSALLNRGRRRSRRSKAEQGAAPTTSPQWSAGRRRAPRKSPRAPGPPSPRYTWVPESWRETPASQAGEGSLASSWRLPALHSLERGRRKTMSPRRRGWDAGLPRARNQRTGAAERWLTAPLPTQSIQMQKRMCRCDDAGK
jgi:hypothetical protein